MPFLLQSDEGRLFFFQKLKNKIHIKHISVMAEYECLNT